jgi:hypothetical protein
MTSPFSTYQEYYEAEGPIYTFANNPTLLGVVLVVAALVFIYFLYSTYTIKKGHSSAPNPIVLSLLILTSAATLLADTVYSQYQKHDRPLSSEVQTPTSKPSQLQPLALLGMIGSGAALSRRKRRGKRDRYQSRRTGSTTRLR